MQSVTAAFEFDHQSDTGPRHNSIGIVTRITIAGRVLALCWASFHFDDLTATYYFGVAAFDNAQVRHAFAAGATPFVFQP